MNKELTEEEKKKLLIERTGYMFKNYPEWSADNYADVMAELISNVQPITESTLITTSKIIRNKLLS